MEKKSHKWVSKPNLNYFTGYKRERIILQMLKEHLTLLVLSICRALGFSIIARLNSNKNVLLTLFIIIYLRLIGHQNTQCITEKSRFSVSRYICEPFFLWSCSVQHGRVQTQFPQTLLHVFLENFGERSNEQKKIVTPKFGES